MVGKLSSNNTTILWTAAAFAAFAIYVMVICDDTMKKGRRKGGKKKKENRRRKQRRFKSEAFFSSKSRCDSDDELEKILPAHLVREFGKDKRRVNNFSKLAMKKPMYDNVRMLDPKGEILCTISKKKAKWYVGKGLAQWHDAKIDSISSSDGTKPLMIRLLFEPKARSNQGGLRAAYTRAEKKNQCVVCGSKDHQVRHYVVPFSYRHFFPEDYKTHVSHDIVVVCGKCNVRCSSLTQRRMNKIEATFEVQPKYLVDHYLSKLNKCASALVNHKRELPAAKISEYEDTIRSFLKRNPERLNELKLSECGDISDETLNRILDIEYQILNPSHVSGAELVVKSLEGDELKIASFVREWRAFFLSTMNPRFLPVGWSIDYSVRRGSDD